MDEVQEEGLLRKSPLVVTALISGGTAGTSPEENGPCWSHGMDGCVCGGRVSVRAGSQTSKTEMEIPPSACVDCTGLNLLKEAVWSAG